MNKRVFNSNGYTLIEFLVVAIVVSIISITIVAILSSTLRGTKKADLVSVIRTNGNQALTQMAKLIKFAKEFKGVSTDDVTYVLDCYNSVVSPTPTPTPVAYKHLKFIGEDDSETTFTCDDSQATIVSNGVSLVDTETVRVSDTNCWFICSQDRITSNPIITIYFELKQAEDTTFAESQFSIPFETSVLLKNLVK